MAPLNHAMLLLLCIVFFSTTATTAAGEAAGSYAGRPTTHLHFYFHEDFSGGPNGTTVTAVAPRSNGSYFGAVYAVDDILREGADPASRLIGRAQGLTVGASLSDSALLTALDLVFTEGPYNSSSLTLLGRALLGTIMERPIIGGTGTFRMARGYTLSKMITSLDPNTQLILEYDAYIWH